MKTNYFRRGNRAEFVPDYVENVLDNKSIELRNRNVRLMKRLEVEHKEKEAILQELKRHRLCLKMIVIVRRICLCNMKDKDESS